MSNFYVGNDVGMLADSLGGARYFYGLRRDPDGYLHFAKVDQLDVSDGIQINNVGDEPSQDYPGFSPGQDFFEGRDTFHNLVYRNLNYEQFRWDDRNIYYYINDDGEFVVRINQSYDYPEDV
jgi:hypothetical protein